MLTQLSTIKSRLSITTNDFDDLLTNALKSITARFDNECNRTFARTVDEIEEFGAEELEVGPSCYPIETVSKFEWKENETDGWIEQTAVAFLIRRKCVLSLRSALGSVS